MIALVKTVRNAERAKAAEQGKKCHGLYCGQDRDTGHFRGDGGDMRVAARALFKGMLRCNC